MTHAHFKLRNRLSASTAPPEEVRVLNLRINRDLTCISGMFTALIEAELFFGEHPIRGTKRLKEEKPDTGYLAQEEIALLLAALDGDNKKIAILCLSTGARWGRSKRLV